MGLFEHSFVQICMQINNYFLNDMTAIFDAWWHIVRFWFAKKRLTTYFDPSLIRALHVVGGLHYKSDGGDEGGCMKSVSGGLQMSSRRALPNFTVWKEQLSLQTCNKHHWKCVKTPTGFAMREFWSGKLSSPVFQQMERPTEETANAVCSSE